MALLEVPFSYEAVIVPPRGRAERRITAMGRVAAIVPEVSATDAPVAAVLEGRFWPMFAADEHAARVDYRAWRGGLIRPYWIGMTDPEEVAGCRVATSPLEAQRDLDAWCQSDVTRAYLISPLGRGSAGVREGEIEARLRVSSDRDARAAEARKAIEEGAAFVDGVLHLPSLGPAWEVEIKSNWHQGGRCQQRVEVRPRVEFGWASANGRETFRGDRSAAALGHARRLVETLKATARTTLSEVEEAPRILGTISVMDAAAFALQDHVVALADASARSMQRAAQHLIDLGPDALRACANLMEAMAAVGQGPRYGAAEAASLLDAARKFSRHATSLNARVAGKDPISEWADKVRNIEADETEAAALAEAARLAVPAPNR